MTETHKTYKYALKDKVRNYYFANAASYLWSTSVGTALLADSLGAALSALLKAKPDFNLEHLAFIRVEVRPVTTYEVVQTEVIG